MQETEDKYNQIIAQAYTVFMQNGIKNVSMDDLCKQMGISKKTLYQYVSDKSELVERVVEHTRHCNFSSLKDIKTMNGNAIEQLIEVSQRVNSLMKDHSPSYEYDLKKYYPEIFQNLMAARREVMYESMLANIRQGKKEGIYREELDEVIISKLHLLRMENLQSNEIFHPL